MTESHRREKIARIIDPGAWEILDDLTPTEREIEELQSDRRQSLAFEKAAAIMALTAGERTDV